MKQEDAKLHTMIRIGAGEGTEEWYCPNCGRRLLLNWAPEFEKVILEVGDQTATHRGDLDSSATQAAQRLPGDEVIVHDRAGIPVEDRWLIPWSRWLDEVGFDHLWNRDI